MSLNHVFWNKWLRSAFLFQFFQRSSWQWQRAWGRRHGRGRRTAGGGEGVGDISVKIILTAFCMHLTLFNQVQVDVHVEFCYLFSKWCGRSKWCKCMYIFHLLINKSVFTVYRYLYNEWMFGHMQFLDVSVQVGKSRCEWGGRWWGGGGRWSWERGMLFRNP